MMSPSATTEDATPVRLEGKTRAKVACWLLGIGSLLSWNTILTVGDYYYKVFPNYHPSRVLTMVHQPFAVGTMVILTNYQAQINTRCRNMAGYTIFFAATLGCILLDVGTSGGGGFGPYLGLCILDSAFGVGNALVLGGMNGDLALMLPEFVQSFFGGVAASGALTSGLRLVTKAAFENSHNGLRKGALLFLSISTGIEFVCIFLYAYYFPNLPIVKHYRVKAASEGSKTVIADLIAAGIDKVEESRIIANQLTLKKLIHQNWDYLLDIYLLYVLTLSIFPGFLYENTGTHKLGSWYALVLIAMYNVLDVMGRYISLIKPLKLKSRWGLMVSVLACYLFIPAFYFTAKYADEGWMIMLVSFLGLINGHLTVCVMTAAPEGYTGPEQNAIGNLMVLFLLGGIFTGVCLDWLWLIGKGTS